jgi:hypothetical protein
VVLVDALGVIGLNLYCLLKRPHADDEIVVTLPGYHYAVTYHKPLRGIGLIARNSPVSDDLRITL